MADESVEISWVFDNVRIEQVIRNLLANALKYDQGGEITIELQKDNQYAYFYIKDNGVGIPADEVKQIFEIFTQASNTAGSGGAGAGLAISKIIIEDHNGKIWFEHRENDRGSLFAFQIPLDLEETLPDSVDVYSQTLMDLQDRLFEEAKKQTHASANLNETKSSTLLLIDDEISILQVSKLVFEKMGFNVLIADSGKKGLDILQNYKHKIDVVLLDMMLPDLNGLIILEKIKNELHLKHLPVYIYSGVGSKEDIEDAMNLGAIGFIDKTSSTKEIAGIMARFLNVGFAAEA